MSYRYLLFDLDETLLDFKGAETAAIRKVLVSFGLEHSDAAVTRYSQINDSFWKRFEKGEIARDSIFEGRFIELARQLKVQLDTAAISEAYFKALSACGFVFEQTIPLLERLHKSYTLCAITNGALRTQTSRILASGIGGYFNGGLYISEAMGMQKPQKAYFDFVLQALGNPPKQEVLVLGDSPSGDMAGGRGAGLDTCFVNLRGQKEQAVPATYTVTRLLDIPKVCGL